MSIAAATMDSAVDGRVAVVASLLSTTEGGEVAARKALVEESRKHRADPTTALHDALNVLHEQKIISDELFKRLDLANQVAELSHDNAGLVRAIDTDEEVNSLRQLAQQWDTQRIANKLGADSLPDGKAAQTVAAEVTRALFNAEPTATVARLVSSDQIALDDPSVKPHVVSVLSGTGANAVDIANTPIVMAAAATPAMLASVPVEKQAAVINEIKTIQRVQAVAPTPEAIPILINNGLTTALSISQVPLSSFVRANSTALGPETARDVHANAVAVRMRNESMLINTFNRVKGTGLSAIDGNDSAADRKQQLMDVADAQGLPQVNFETLFRGMDECVCPECKTVYSLAAYFVELMGYLRNNNRDPYDLKPDTTAAGTKPSLEGTVLEKLLRRRPDLAELELTCENANTIVPYIDLVNEVMESFIVHLDAYKRDFHIPKQAVIDTFNITEGDVSEDLLAQPEYTNFDAYHMVATAAYPFTLPYHQPIDAMRIFLGLMGVDRADLLDAFGPKAVPKAGTDLEALRLSQQVVLERQVDAERLKMIQEEYITLTKQAFWPKEYFHAEGTEMSDDGYRTLIARLEPVHKYFGYDTAEALAAEGGDEEAKKGLRWVKSQFLKRSGVSWTELVQIVQTEFINPLFPKGRDKAILDRLQYSYRFLMTLIDEREVGVKKYAKLANFLIMQTKLLPLAALLGQESVPSLAGAVMQNGGGQSRGKNGGCLCADDDDVREWVYLNFEALGNVVVLDHNEGPTLPVSGPLFATPLRENVATALPRLPSSAVGFVHPDGRITDASGDVWGSIDSSSRMIVGSAVDNTTFFDVYGKDYAFEVSGSKDSATMNDEGVLFLRSSAKKVEWGLNPNMGGACNIDDVTLTHLNGSPLTMEEWDRMHRFIRLRKRLGWTVGETDMALAGLTPKPTPAGSMVDGDDKPLSIDDFADTLEGYDDYVARQRKRPGPADINPSILHQLTKILGIVKLKGLAVEKVLTLGTTIPTKGAQSLYARLFLTRGLPGDNTVFLPDVDGNYLLPGKGIKISDNMLRLMAAFTLRAADIQAALNADGDSRIFRVADELSLEVISQLHRYSLLSKMLQLGVADTLSVLGIFGNPLQQPEVVPEKVLSMLETWEKFKAAGLGFEGLRYAIMGVDSVPRPLGPDTPLVLKTASALRDGLRNINDTHKDVSGEDEATKELVAAKAHLILGEIETAGVASLLEGTTVYITTQNVPKGLNLSGKSSALEKKLTYSKDSGVLQITGILTEAETVEAKALIVEESPNPIDTAAVQMMPKAERDAVAKVKEQRQARWAAAIDYLGSQPHKFFVEVLARMFPDDADEKELLAGDISPKADNNSSSETTADGSSPNGINGVNGVVKKPIVAPVPVPAQADGRTAAQKRAFFLSKFLPLLRQKLAQILIIDTMKGATGLDSQDLTITLLNILTVDTSITAAPETRAGTAATETALRSLIQSLASPADQDAGDWSGYLLSPSSDSYTFSIIATHKPAPLKLGDRSLQFVKQAGSEEVIPGSANSIFLWSTGPTTNLDSGTLYRLELSHLDPSELQWQGSSSPRIAIPETALLPDSIIQDTRAVLVKLRRAAVIVSTFKLTSREIQYSQRPESDLQHQQGDFYVDFNQIDLNVVKRIQDYAALRDSLPVSTTSTLGDFFSYVTNLGDSPTPADQSKTINQIAGELAKATGWDQESIQQIVKQVNFPADKPSLFRDEKVLVRLQKLLHLGEKLGVEIPVLFRWCRPLPPSQFWKFHDISQDIQRAARARYDVKTWEGVVKPLNDALRENQKQAMISYLLVQDEIRSQGYEDADGLFEFFLIDVQMTSLVETSRLKQAVATVQLFVQRCLLGLETGGGNAGVSPGALDRKRWDNMKNYTIWEASRKVFCYPENWIEPTLRDDKSPFYLELEGELMQKDLSKDAVSAALKNYVYKVEEVANLSVAGLFVEYVANTTAMTRLHIFARTRTAPFTFYYRYYDATASNWYPWGKMDIDIPRYVVEATQGAKGTIRNVGAMGTYLLPVVWNNRMLLFVPQITKRTQPPDLVDQTDTTASPKPEKFGGLTDTNIRDANPVDTWDVKMSWTEYKDGKWSQRKLSADSVTVLPEIRPNQGTSPTTENPPSKILNPVDAFLFTTATTVTGNDGKITIRILRVEKTTSQENLILLGAFDFTGGQIIKAAQPNGSHTVLSGFGDSFASFGFRVYNTNSSFYSTQEPIEDIKKLPRVDYPDSQSYESNLVLPGRTPDSTDTTELFYHKFAHKMMSKLMSTKGVDALFSYFTAMKSEDLSQAYGGVLGKDLKKPLFSELKKPYSLYNWELGLHAPMALADRLLKSQQFDDALNVIHYIFNPLAPGHELDRSKVWMFPPFKSVAVETLEEFFIRVTDSKIQHQDITEWRDNPFQPHVVARSRPLAYMKWVVMKYIEILIAYGDYYFRLNTLETLPNAIQMYVLASHLYGSRGQKILRQTNTKPQTYMSLLEKFDAFSNAMVVLEENFPFSNQTTLQFGMFPSGETPPGTKPPSSEKALANVFGFATTLYFAIPDNPNLRALGTLIDDRLFKLRHSQDINGVTRILPLYDPPIDPALLVQAAAQGLKLSSVLADLNGPMPNYRFEYLLGKALELTNELKSISSSLLSIHEKQDGEALSNLRALQDTTLSTMTMDLKKLSLADATKTLEALEYSRKAPVSRLQFFISLIGADASAIPDVDADFQELVTLVEKPIDDGGLKLIPYEKEESDKYAISQHLTEATSGLSILASVFEAIPRVTTHGTPLGVGVAAGFGGSELSAITRGVASGLGIGSEVLTYQAGSAGRKANQLRALQDRVQQANAAGYEIKNIDKQMLSSRIRIDMASNEITIQQTQINQMKEVEQFLKSKYSNTELYNWMENSMRSLYYETYTNAYDLAKKAEKVFQFERPQEKTSFIQVGYWDPARDGLLAGERLYMALKKLESAYQDKRAYDYEITKHVSLRQLNPLALILLRETGTCEFSIPESLYDLDFPGHYLRRLKSVSVTIPAIVGPYTTANCTLRLTNNRLRIDPSIANGYPEILDGNIETRFISTNVPIQAIAVTSGQNDSGLFELNFKDERYIPFEGAGAISSWKIDLPPVNVQQFDYTSITDVILHLKYTSVDGGESFRKSVVENITKLTTANESGSGFYLVADVKNEFASGWARLTQPPPAGTTTTTTTATKSLPLPGLETRLPIFAQGRTATATDIFVVADADLGNTVALVDARDARFALAKNAVPELGKGKAETVGYGARGQSVRIGGGGAWKLEVAGGEAAGRVRRCWLVVQYSLG